MEFARVRSVSGRLAVFMLCTVVFLGLSIPILAQSTTDGAIAGTVMDTTGAVIPNAKIVILNSATNAEQTTTSDASGYFRVGMLPPAEYLVTITAAGFAPFRVDKVPVHIGSVAELSPKLNVGSATEKVVEVTAEAAVINTNSAEFAPVVNQTSISNLPINGGRWSNFVLLTPGVVNDSNGFGLVSFKGMSTLLNNNTVDGADNNQAFFSEERGRTRGAYAFPKAAVQEFQVNISNYSSEYGRSAGGVINSVTKSGTNKLHGEMYFYDRDNDWGAFNPYATIRVAPTYQAVPIKPKDWRKMSGVSVGGPIIKDRLFFQFTYDWYHRNFPGMSVAFNPTAFYAPCGNSATTGLTGCTPNNTATVTQLLSASTSANISNLAYRVYGANNATTQAQAVTLYNTMFSALSTTSGPTPREGEQTIWFPKLDWQINQKHHFSIAVDRQRWASPAGIQTQNTNTYGIRSFGNDYVKVTTGVAKLNSFITNNLANELRVSYGRDFEFESPQQPTDLEKNYLVSNPAVPSWQNPYGLPPEVTLGANGNGWNLGVANFLNRPKYPSEYRQQYADTFTMVRGKHTFKFGEDYTRVLDDTANLRYQYGSFNYGTNLINFFSDLVKPRSCQTTINSVVTNVPCYTSFQQGFGPQGFKFSTNEYAFFAQDDWRIHPRLTLNIGLRWDYEKMPEPFSNLVNPAIPQTSKLPDDKNNFGPRIGFAFDVFGNGKTALRGGYGIYYARVINSTIYNALTNTGMAGGQFQYTFTPTNATTSQCALAFPMLTTSALPAAACQSGGSVVFFDNHFQNPQIHQANLSLEQDLGWNTVMAISYLGSYGRELPDFTDMNIAPATKNITYAIVGGPFGGASLTVPIYTTRRNYGGYTGTLTDVFSGTTSNYNGLAVQFGRRMTNHLQFNTNFTWSHAIDYGQNNTTFTSSNALLEPDNIKMEKGNSNQNVPLRFVFSAVAESPWKVSNKVLALFANDWQMAPLFQWQNGLPFTMGISGSVSSLTGSGALSSGINGSGGASRFYGSRNQYKQPNMQVFDLRLSKYFRFRERYSIEFSGEAFNLFNHQNVTGVTGTSAYTVGGSLAAPTLTYTTSGFGVPNNANSNFAWTPRQIQLGVRVKF